MKGWKRSYGFYISVAILGLAIAASAFFYKTEAAKAKRIKREVTEWTEHLNAMRIGIPTEKHREFVQEQKVEVEKNFEKIVRGAMFWNYGPPRVSALDFLGNMKETIRLLEADAKRRQILIGRKARYLGFDEYAAAPPGPDDDVLQLEREFSAAVDIAQLLIESNVYSIDVMERRDDALMEEGTSTFAAREMAELTGTSRLKKPKYDFYDAVPFRVKFTCTYPSLAFFQKSLITPMKVAVGNERLPRNFLVVNDLQFKVKEAEGESEKLAMELDRTWTAAYTIATGRSAFVPDIPDDLPGAELMWTRDPATAAVIFRNWRNMKPEEKEIYRLNRRLGENISGEDKERALVMLQRMNSQLQDRKKLEGRPPEYSVIEVNMLIDFVQFNDKLTEDLEAQPSVAKGSTASPQTAER